MFDMFINELKKINCREIITRLREEYTKEELEEELFLEFIHALEYEILTLADKYNIDIEFDFDAYDSHVFCPVPYSAIHCMCIRVPLLKKYITIVIREYPENHYEVVDVIIEDLEGDDS